MKKPNGLRVVATFEAAKGVLVLLAAGLLVRFLHSSAQEATQNLVAHFHLNPARHYPRVFTETLAHLGNGHLVALSFGALCYAIVRFVEAYGLWRERAWAWGFGILSAGLYVPFELAELARRVTWPALTVFVLNILIVAVLWASRRRQQA